MSIKSTLFLKNKNFIFTLLLIFSFFYLLFRFLLIKNYPFFSIQPDSYSYFFLYENLKNGITPIFYDRSPGYPLILYTVFSIFGEKVINIVLFQFFLSFVSGIMLILFVNSFINNKILLFLSSIIIFFTINSSIVVNHDMAMLTESTYFNFLIITFLLMYFSLLKHNKFLYFLTSSFTAIIILIKPAGLFMLVIFLIHSFYIFFKYRHFFYYYLLPFIVIISLNNFYNYKTFNKFTITATDSRELTLVNNLFWDKDNNYPEEINKAIETVQKYNLKKVPNEKYSKLKNSWNILEIYPIYLYGHDYFAETQIRKVFNYDKRLSHIWLNKINYDTIKKKPDLFFKHYITMMVAYYGSNLYKINFFDDINYRIRNIFINQDYKNNIQLNKMYLEMKNYRLDDFKNFFISTENNSNILKLEQNSILEYVLSKFINKEKKTKVIEKKEKEKFYINIKSNLTNTFLQKIFNISNKILNNIFFLVIFLLCLFVSLYELLYRRKIFDCKYNLDWIFFIICIANFGAASIVSLAEYSQPRYSYPLHWQYYICLFYLFSKINGLSKTN